MEQKFFTSRRITLLAVLLALVLVLQTLATFLPRLGISITLTLVPIVIGGMLLGPVSGGILGFMFGIITVIYGATGLDGFTALLFEDHPFLTILTCIVKGTSAGAVPALIYKAMSKKHRYMGTFLAAASAPVVNTGLFILGALCMLDTIERIPDRPSGQSVIYFLFMGIVLVNFLIEFALNLVLSPAIYRVLEVMKGSKFK